MAYVDSPYFHVGRATELSGKDRLIYRALEILPGFLAWGTILGIFVLSFLNPFWAAYFIIAFDLYWLLKTVYLSTHLRHNWRRVKHNLNTDWEILLKNIKHEHLVHLVILPFYKEGLEVIEQSVESLLQAQYDKKKLAIVLAGEERAGSQAQSLAKQIEDKYKNKFGYFLVTTHPKDLPGEMAGKGSNISYSAEEARKHILDKNKINYKNVIVSAFDIDTVVYPQYFLCLSWNFLTVADPYKVSFQPVPFYNNNIWQTPALSRVVASSSTFWQMIQQERPEKLATFSSHSVSFDALYKAKYWQRNMVSEDSRIFWNMFLAHDGDYSVIPIAYPVSMDANLASSFWQTMKNIYKQNRRWAWGVENVPYIIFNFIKNKNIPLGKKLRMGFVQVEGFWSLATNPIMIFLLGWMPIVLGGKAFNSTVLAYNLPILTRDIMILAMLGLVFSAIISMSLLPKPPKEKKHLWLTRIFLVLQWVLIPITITVFGAIPGLDAQTRLLLGRYMGFWVTPKHRK